jgi:hypothetical protein
VNSNLGFVFDATDEKDIEIGKEGYEQLRILATPADYECWDSEDLDAKPDTISNQTDSQSWDSDENISEDAISEVISRKLLDDEEDFISQKSVHELIAEITASFDESTILDDDSSHPHQVPATGNCAEQSSVDMALLDSKPVSKARSSKDAVDPISRSPEVIKRSNQALKSDGLYQPIQHLLCQK